MQAAATTPCDGSASDETSTVRLATGLVATLLAVAVFMVTQDGDSSAEHTTTPDEAVHLIATSQAADGTATETTCTGFLTGDGRVMTSSRCLADPRYLGDQVTVVHNPTGDSSKRSRAATTGVILGDHLYVDLEPS